MHLAGPAWNRDGLGAQVRLLSGKSAGPIRELHAGSGYWSQDSAVAVLSTVHTPTELWVRWPGGAEQKVPVPRDARDLTVSAPK